MFVLRYLPPHCYLMVFYASCNSSHPPTTHTLNVVSQSPVQIRTNVGNDLSVINISNKLIKHARIITNFGIQPDIYCSKHISMKIEKMETLVVISKSRQMPKLADLCDACTFQHCLQLALMTCQRLFLTLQVANINCRCSLSW